MCTVDAQSAVVYTGVGQFRSLPAAVEGSKRSVKQIRGGGKWCLHVYSRLYIRALSLSITAFLFAN